MKILTPNLPDTIDPAYALWTLAHALYKEGALNLDQAASLVGMAPTYFRRRLEDIEAGPFSIHRDHPKFQRGNHLLNKPFDRKRFDELVKQMDIQEPLDQLLGMLTK